MKFDMYNLWIVTLAAPAVIVLIVFIYSLPTFIQSAIGN